jgi:hypothetical protein
MTQGEFTYLLMVIGALTIFAAVLAYGAWMAPGKPHMTADIRPLPKRTGVAERRKPEEGTKEAA